MAVTALQVQDQLKMALWGRQLCSPRSAEEAASSGPDSAFAAILEDGSVVTWGDPGWGGDSSAVQDQLKSVQQVQATDSAFAAILEDGSVVTWGDPGRGGDSSAAQDQLMSV